MKKMGRLWMQVEEIRGVLEAAKRGIHSQLETRAARILKKKKTVKTGEKYYQPLLSHRTGEKVF